MSVLPNAHDDSNNGSGSQQTYDYPEETCPLDGPGIRRGCADIRAGLSWLLDVYGGRTGDLA